MRSRVSIFKESWRDVCISPKTTSVAHKGGRVEQRTDPYSRYYSPCPVWAAFCILVYIELISDRHKRPIFLIQGQPCVLQFPVSFLHPQRIFLFPSQILHPDPCPHRKLTHQRESSHIPEPGFHCLSGGGVIPIMSSLVIVLSKRAVITRGVIHPNMNYGGATLCLSLFILIHRLRYKGRKALKRGGLSRLRHWQRVRRSRSCS